MIAAVLIERSKTVLPDGAIVEIVVWKVPEPVPGSHTCSSIDCFTERTVAGSSVSTTNAVKAIIVTLTELSILTRSRRTDTLLSDFRKEIIKRRQKP